MTIGYYKDADKNREAFDDERLFPHRRSRLPRRADYLHFRGRLKEMIKTGGINVAPVEVEESLLRASGRASSLSSPACPMRGATR